MTSKLSIFALGAVFAVAACESATPGSTGPEVPGISKAALVDDPGDGSAGFETLEICKVWEAPSALSTDFTVTVEDAGGTEVGNPTLLDSSSDPTLCRVVARFDGLSPATLLEVVETEPDGAELYDITWSAVDPDGNDITASAAATYNVDVDVATGTWSAEDADNEVGFIVFYFNRELPVVVGGEGCTPGFWKNRGLRLGWPAPYAPGDSYDTVFGVVSDFGGTLLDAVRRGGGGEIALGRHAVAALLNAASPDVEFDLTEAEVIALVQAAYASGDFEDAKDELEPFNEQNAAGFCE